MCACRPSPTKTPARFGLLQRDRDFEHYQDLEASYHARPSLLVEPLGKWGKGAVRLVEIPTTTEFDDNIVAFWMPEKLPPPGEAIEMEYRLTWALQKLGPPAGFVRSTRHGKSARYEPGMERFVVDFDGAALRQLPADARIEQSRDGGTGRDAESRDVVQKNAINGRRGAWRSRSGPMARTGRWSCAVSSAAARISLTETWSYLWNP